MFTKEIKCNVLGKKTYNKKTDKGTEYTLTYYCVAYKEPENKSLEGYNVETLKYRGDMTVGKEYEITVVIQKKDENTYYKEIVSAHAIK